jgi:hypothetical protein
VRPAFSSGYHFWDPHRNTMITKAAIARLDRAIQYAEAYRLKH